MLVARGDKNEVEGRAYNVDDAFPPWVACSRSQLWVLVVVVIAVYECAVVVCCR